MVEHNQLSREALSHHLKTGKIALAGNLRMKIYGLLTCSSGKRMKKENRVFFKNETEAVQLGFRPCGHCLHSKYILWRNL
jgi:methylphosphotriester-DNA--protein-cysteine methyltransferase